MLCKSSAGGGAKIWWNFIYICIGHLGCRHDPNHADLGARIVAHCDKDKDSADPLDPEKWIKGARLGYSAFIHSLFVCDMRGRFIFVRVCL